jgi:proline dehydrogenase
MGLIRVLLLRASESRTLRRVVPRLWLARRMVRRFMPGETMQAALAATRELNAASVGAVLTCLGENVDTPAEADAVVEHYQELITSAGDADIEVSIKPTHLGLDFDEEGCLARIAKLAAACAARGRFLWVDMEGRAYTDRTLALYRALRPTHANLGICLQANLRRTPEDAASLLPLQPAIRLVKGAYAEPAESAHAKRAEIDAAYEALGAQLFQRAVAGSLRLVLGTHDLDLANRIRAAAIGRLEIHMLYGIRTRDQERLARDPATQLRVLISYGDAWYPWFVRRLAEKPANLLLGLR